MCSHERLLRASPQAVMTVSMAKKKQKKKKKKTRLCVFISPKALCGSAKVRGQAAFGDERDALHLKRVRSGTRMASGRTQRNHLPPADEHSTDVSPATVCKHLLTLIRRRRLAVGKDLPSQWFRKLAAGLRK